MGGQMGPGFGPGGVGWHDAVQGAHAWWEVFGAIVPSILLVVLIVVVAWGALRLSRVPAAAASASIPAVPGGAVTGDPALEQLRLRYARGEVERQAFLDASRDLGGDGADAAPEAP